MKPYKSAKNIG